MRAGTGRARGRQPAKPPGGFATALLTGALLTAATMLAACQTTQQSGSSATARPQISSAALAAGKAQCLGGETLTEQPNGVLSAVAPSFAQKTPRRVAVLPFAVAGNEEQRAAEQRQADAFQVTTTFRNHFSNLPYQDVEWEAIRKVAERRGLSVAGDLDSAALTAVGRELNADAVLIGTVHRVERIFALAVGQIAAEAELKLIRLEDDCLLWQARHVVRHNKGGISFSPVGLALQAVQTAISLNEQAQIAAVDELARDLVAAAPVPEGSILKTPAKLLTAGHSGRAGALGAGKVLSFEIAVDRSLARIAAEVGEGFSVPLSEHKVDQGVFVYRGERRIENGDDVAAATVRYDGVDDLGNEVSFVDPSGPVTIDTVAPAAPRDIRANFLGKSMRLSWAASADADVVAYDVWRSASALTGYSRLGESETGQFDDGKPLAPVGYYRVRARDRAGNLSAVEDAIAGRQVRPGPTKVSGVIDRDTTWYAAASPYVLEGEVRVARGTRLSVEPGVRVQLGDRAGIRVDGQLVAQSGKGAPITWTAAGDARWQGIRIDSAVASAESRIEGNEFSGATTALTVRSSDPVLRNNTFLRNGVGLSVEDTADPELSGNVFRNNGTALRIVAADPLLIGNSFSHNADAAVEVVGASPVIRENQFRDNDGPSLRIRQQSRSAILEASSNWWGTIEKAAIVEQIDGAANFQPVLNGPPPDGVAVAARDSLPSGGETQVAETAPPADPVRAMLDGLKLMDSGKPREALAMLRPLESVATGNPILQYTLSLLYFETGDAAAALVAIDRAVSSNPAAPNFHLSRAQILRTLNRQDEAREALRTVLRLQPGNRTAQHLLSGAVS